MSEEDKYNLIKHNKLPNRGILTWCETTERRRGFSKKSVSKIREEDESVEYTHYSASKNVAICLPCAFYVSESEKYYPSAWVNGFNRWKKLGGKEKGMTIDNN